MCLSCAFVVCDALTGGGEAQVVYVLTTSFAEALEQGWLRRAAQRGVCVCVCVYVLTTSFAPCLMELTDASTCAHRQTHTHARSHILLSPQRQPTSAAIADG